MFTLQSRIRTARRIAAVSAVVVFAACGDDGGTAVAGDFAFSIAPGAVSVQQGQLGQVTATLSRSGGFTGPLSATVEGAPAGVTVEPTTFAAGSTSARITVKASSSVAPGTYPITVRVTGEGVAAKTVPLSLVVTASPNSALTLNPAALLVGLGGQGSVTATIVRESGVSGPVNLTVTGMPEGMTVNAPAIAAGSSTSTITVNVGASVAPNVYTLTVSTNANGMTPASATLVIGIAIPAN